MMKKIRVLLFSEGFGTGHTQAAHSLSVGLKRIAPDVQTRVIELGTFLNPIVAPFVIDMYRRTVSTRPSLIGLLYRSKYEKPLNTITQLALHRLFYARASKLVSQLRPDAIICTHPFPNIIISRLKRAGLNVPLYTLITDYDAHGSWVDDHVSTYLVSADIVKQKLMTRGVPEERILVSGIPVHPKFWDKLPQAEAQVELGLQQLPTVMFMGGGWGLSLQDVQLQDITKKWSDKIQFIFCMGSNQKMIERMKQDPTFKHPNVHIYGFTSEIPKLMDASNLLVTKPGGMSCTEGMLKRIPMLFDAPIPGQEEENCRYFIERGHGEMLTDRDVLERWLETIADHHGAASLQQLRQPLQTEELEKCPRIVNDLLNKQDHKRNEVEFHTKKVQ